MASEASRIRVGQGEHGSLRATMPSFQRHVFVCINERSADHPRGCCKAKGGVEIRDRLKKELSARGLSKLVRANQAGCLDQCEHGVSVVVYPEQVWYGHVTVDDIPELVDRHLVGGHVVERLLMPDQPHLDEARELPPLRTADERSGEGGSAPRGVTKP
jgi:(2Fe-2S) ferredoxin